MGASGLKENCEQAPCSNIGIQKQTENRTKITPPTTKKSDTAFGIIWHCLFWNLVPRLIFSAFKGGLWHIKVLKGNPKTQTK